MIEKIEYGTPQVYAFLNNSDGSVSKDTAITVSAYDDATKILTLSAPITVSEIDQYVVFHETGENNYGFGKVLTTTTVELHEDSKDHFISTSPATSLEIYSGMGVASFTSCEIGADVSSADFKGQYVYNKNSIPTDYDSSFTLTEVIFTPEFSALINNYKANVFSDGKVQDARDFDVFNDKEVRPNNVTLIALKRRTENDDKWEEFQLHNLRTGGLEIPTERDGFVANTYTFLAQAKNRADESVFDYNVEI